jgi:hypothetical protein
MADSKKLLSNPGRNFDCSTVIVRLMYFKPNSHVTTSANSESQQHGHVLLRSQRTRTGQSISSIADSAEVVAGSKRYSRDQNPRRTA